MGRFAMHRQRLFLRRFENGLCILQDNQKGEKEFPTLLQALQYAQSVGPNEEVHVTVLDAKGNPTLEAFL